MSPILAGTFLNTSGVATNGIAISAWRASRFSGVPAAGASAPSGSPDATGITTASTFGGQGGYQISVPTSEPYYIQAVLSGTNFWQYAVAVSGPVPNLIAVADNGITDNASTLTTQLAFYRSIGLTACRLPGAASAYGLGSTVPVPSGMHVFGDGPLAGKYPPHATSLTAGTYYGTAVVCANNWAEPTNGIDVTPLLSGFDVRQDTCTITSGSSTVADTAITAADANRPVNGFGIPQGVHYVGNVVVGVSYQIQNGAGTPVNATANGTRCSIGTNLPLGGLFTLESATANSYGGTNLGGAWITGITVNCTGDGVASTATANVGIFGAGTSSKARDCLLLDGNFAGLTDVGGTAGGTAEDSEFSFLTYSNRQPTYSSAPLTLTGTVTKSGALLSGITNLPTNGAIWNGVVSYKGTGGTATSSGQLNGAAVKGTGIPIGTFVAPGGYLANGTGTLLLTNAPTSAFTGTDITIVQSDCVGQAIRNTSADVRMYEPVVSAGTINAQAADLKVHGGNMFGSSANAILVGPAITAASVSGTTVTCTAVGTWVTGEPITIAGLANGGGANWVNANGTFVILSGGTNTFTYTVSSGTPTGASDNSGTASTAPYVGQYTIISKGKGSNWTGCTFGPGPGNAFASMFRRDGGIVTITGGFFEMDGNTVEVPAFEDNDPSTTTGSYNISGLSFQPTTAAPLSSIIYRVDGTTNVRSSVVANLTASNLNGTYWSGGGFGVTVGGGTPGMALLNIEGTGLIQVGIGSPPPAPLYESPVAFTSSFGAGAGTSPSGGTFTDYVFQFTYGTSPASGQIVQITHNLGFIPNVRLVVPESANTAQGKPYIGTVTTTTISIEVQAAPGSGGGAGDFALYLAAN